MKKPKLFILFLIFIVVSLSIVQVAVSNMLATSGLFLDRLNTEIEYYEMENSKLFEKLLLKSSLTEVASEAANVGFVGRKSQIVLTNQPPIALKQ